MSKRAPAKPEAADSQGIPPFSGGDGNVLRERLTFARIIAGGEKPPKKEACDALAEKIAHTRRQVQIWRDPWRPIPCSKLVATAAKRLVDALTALEADVQSNRQELTSLCRKGEVSQDEFQELTEQGERAVAVFRHTISSTLTEVDYLSYLIAMGQTDEAEAIKKITSDWQGYDDWRYDDWNDADPMWPCYVEYIADEYRKAMLTSNNEAPRLGDNNSLSRFLADVIPYISDETPPKETIMRCLQRRANKRRGQ